MTQAVILAGGKGTRLESVAGNLPKPLVPIGGVAVVQRQIELLVRYGIREVFLTTGYRAEVLEERLGDGAQWGVELHHVREDRPLGTAGGVAALRGRLDDDFIVVYGDVLVHMDLARLLDFHRRSSSDATLVVHPNDHPHDSDLVDLGIDGKVRAFYPKPRPADSGDLPNMVSAALYVLSPRALAHIQTGTAQDFVRDVFPRMLAAGANLYAYHTTEYLKDMGTPERLERVERDLEDGVVHAMHADHLRPTFFLDRDGVINRETDGVLRPDDLELLPGAGAAIRRINRAGWLAAVVTNQPAIAKGFMSSADVEAVHLRLQRRLGETGAWLDRIVHCPHHPKSGFEGERPELKVMCDCRKPKAGMLETVSSTLPVDRSNAVMVGDSWRDMVAAHVFGAEAVGVMTGHAMAHSPPEEFAVPGRCDVLAEDLPQAVALVLESVPVVESLADEIAAKAAGEVDRRGVLIGGLARAGKSTSAFRLRRALRKRGVRALCVRLDDWIVPASERPANSTLQERYRMSDAGEAFLRLLDGQAIQAPGYDSDTRERLAKSVTYDAGDAAVVVFEGVPALLLRAPEDVARVYVEAPSEEERRRRLMRSYSLKGLSIEETEERLQEREEEHEIVRGMRSGAHVKLESG